VEGGDSAPPGAEPTFIDFRSTIAERDTLTATDGDNGDCSVRLILPPVESLRSHHRHSADPAFTRGELRRTAPREETSSDFDKPLRLSDVSSKPALIEREKVPCGFPGASPDDLMTPAEKRWPRSSR
jgi:hypothetical protein